MEGFRNYKAEHRGAAKPSGGDNKKADPREEGRREVDGCSQGEYTLNIADGWRIGRRSRGSKPPLGSFHVFGVELDTNVPAAQYLGSEQRASGACEGIEDDIAALCERLDYGLERRYRLLRRVQPVTGVAPFKHVSDGGGRQRWVPFDEQIGLLMAVAEKAPS